VLKDFFNDIVDKGTELIDDASDSASEWWEGVTGDSTPNIDVEGAIDENLGSVIGRQNEDGSVDSATIKDQGNKKDKVSSKKASNGHMYNELDVFASYNTIFSLFALTDDEINNPDATYRSQDPEITILRSGGGVNAPGGFGLEQYDGKLEYFIEDVNIESLISPNVFVKQTNATKIEFTVHEPYSMGQFILSIMQASKRAKFGKDVNYLTSPYLLTMEFVGWDDNGKPVSTEVTSKIRRMIPFMISDIQFDVNEGGSKYRITGVPWNEQALLQENQTLNVTHKLVGRTVKELCQTSLYSLANAFNEEQQRQKKKSKGDYTPDEYLIVFPELDKNGEPVSAKITAPQEKEERATGIVSMNTRADPLPQKSVGERKLETYFEQSVAVRQALDVNRDGIKANFKKEVANILAVSAKRSDIGEVGRAYADSETTINDIGAAKMSKSSIHNDKHPFFRPLYAELNDKKQGIFNRNRINISDGLVEFDFDAGTSIQDMVEEVILMSEYGRGLLEQTPVNDFYKWFRVDFEVYPIDSSTIPSRGRSAQLFVFRVYPYKMHKSRFQSLTASNDVNWLYDNAVKKYQYIYTGKNDSIINFDIQFNKAFFTALTHAYDTKSQTQVQSADSRAANSNQSNYTLTKVEGGESSTGNREAVAVAGPTTGRAGGSHGEVVETAGARDWNDIFLNSNVDLINIELEIIGDPYFLSDSGMGNYHSSSKSFNLTTDNTMNYANGEVHIVVEFKTPIDYPYSNGTKDGFMQFKDKSLPVKSFSGVYQVIRVNNIVTEGKFTQKLNCIRVRNQFELDTDVAPSEDKITTIKPSVESWAGLVGDFQSNQAGTRNQAGGASGVIT
jgi:hypothetical protein